MPRIPERALEDADPVVQAVFQRFAGEGREPIALYRVLAAAPWLLDAYNAFAVAMRHEATLSRALRELVILRTSQLAGSDYEWSHHVPMARAAGVPDAKIRALGTWRAAGDFDRRERAALGCAEAVHGARMDAEGFALVRGSFSEAESVELVGVCAFYAMVGRLVQAFDVDVEPAYAPHLREMPPNLD
ncbi:MAG TPA: carboxymuconolactone decarboxylase family protein [Solirubrobacteraceae bacterium]|nr:carboxymuconolactone decarboxylase family protein [Solirubrobacteraceae bacterium]